MHPGRSLHSCILPLLRPDHLLQTAPFYQEPGFATRIHFRSSLKKISYQENKQEAFVAFLASAAATLRALSKSGLVMSTVIVSAWALCTCFGEQDRVSASGLTGSEIYHGVRFGIFSHTQTKFFLPDPFDSANARAPKARKQAVTRILTR